jgi:signal transduction histidine kinase
MNDRSEEVGRQARKRRSVAERYLTRTRWRMAASYGFLLAVMLIAIIAVTYAAARTHEAGQIHDQLVGAAREKLNAPDLPQVLRQSPHLKDEEEAVRTFIISRDGVLRDGDAVTRRPPNPAAVTRVLHGGNAGFTTIPGPAGVLSVYTVPIIRGGTVIGAIQTVTAESPYNIVLQYLLLVSLVVGGIGLLLAAAVGILMADWGLRPIRTAIESQQAFAQNAAHELRTPLTLIRTAAELALRADEPDEMRDALTTTIPQTEHLDAVVGDLRLVAQGDTGHILIDVEPLDLGLVAGEVDEEVLPVAEARRVHIQLHAAAGVSVTGDRQRLRQLLLILTDNALQHTDTGGRIDITVTRQARKAVLSVQDTGSGIESRHLPHIFDRFFRAEEARSRHQGGAGLGLAIAREIVEAHGGRIVVESQVGIGATFRVFLPSNTSPSRPTVS